MPVAFPASLEQLDCVWLTQALHACGRLAAEGRVTRFDVAPIGSGFGQTGESVRLLLHYELASASGPASAFIKFATADLVRREASRRLRLYRREVDFYTRLAPQASVRVPACYFAEASPEGDLATVLLEDFPDHRPGDDLIGLQPPEARLAVALLADLHGPFWGRAGTLGLEPLLMGTRDRFALAWDEVERSFGDQMPPAVRAVRERYLDAIAPLHDWLVSDDATLGHGDLKLDNILFGPAISDPIVAVDWQAVRPQRGMRDVAYLISHSMNVADRRAHERDLLARYVAALAAYGVDYPTAAIEEDYRLSMLFDFCTVLYIVGINLNTNDRAIRRKRALMERSITALLDWDAFALLTRFA